MALPVRPTNANWQQPDEPVVPIGARDLVSPSHECPSTVAYCFSNDLRIFWDLGYLSDSFEHLGISSDWFSAKSLQRRFKELALSFDLSDHLHLRGVEDRLGLGGDNSSYLVGMGVSNHNKISSGSRDSTKILNRYIYIYIGFLFRSQMMMKLS